MIAAAIGCVSWIIVTAIKHSCKHEWEQIGEERLMYRVHAPTPSDLPRLIWVKQKCEICGRQISKVIFDADNHF